MILTGPLRYLIGIDNAKGAEGVVTEVSYDTDRLPAFGTAIAYCNLFDEKYEERHRYPPYLHDSDTASEYDEGQIDPKGPGWHANLKDQFTRRKASGFTIIELDNPDAYHLEDVLGAVAYAETFGFKVIAKNPGLVEGNNIQYVAHPAVVGMIVEKGAGTCDGMHDLRSKAGKPALWTQFVSFGNGRPWCNARATTIQYRKYVQMGVSFSSIGEYKNSISILDPKDP